ncbi:MAG: Gfo/Idh/MocA family oxidoreductase [Verrucomicrobiia bacterium]
MKHATNKPLDPMFNLSRRNFLRSCTAGALLGAPMIVPRHVIAASGQTPPSEKINIASIGVGGMGHGDVMSVSRENLVAFCDVDETRAAKTFQKLPNVRRFQDFRKMFDAIEKQIDAVTVSTPDHTHAVAAMAAIKRGKHVYCQKPLAHSVHEIRQLMAAAREHNVVTQLGNQGHSSESIRIFCEWIWAGAIGTVHTIHAGCKAVNSAVPVLPSLKETHEVPGTLNWDLWLGPTKQRPYNPNFLPGRWRGWVPFGNGTVGDWICHVVDPVFWALDLGAPATIQATTKDYDFKTQGDAYPPSDIITYEFPAKGKRGPVKLVWHSGAKHIPRPPELESERQDIETGAAVYGDKGTITYGSHGAGGVRIVPETKMQAYKRPEKTLPRVKEHHQDWLDAIRAGRKAGSDFSYGGPLTELALLGIISIKMGGQKLEWDAEKMRFTNCPEANSFLNPPYRSGWEL